MDDDEDKCIVIDNGACNYLAGFAGDDGPRCSFPCVAGRRPGSNDVLCGDVAFKKRSELDITSPVQRGLITNWDDMEKIWHHSFYKELCVKSLEEYSVITSEPALTPKSHREKTAELMFETFGVTAFCACNTAALSLYASGRGEAVMLEMGEGKTCAVAVTREAAGRVQCHDAVEQQNVAGRDITNYLMTKLTARRELRNIDYYTVENIKEECCYVADDYQKELTTPKAKSYQLPDGRDIDLGRECFTCPEAMFRPYSTPLNLTYGIHEMVNRAILRSTQDSEELRKHLYCNIIVSGGGTLMEGFCERLSKEIKVLAPSRMVKIVAPPERKYSAWIGGSIVGSLSLFPKFATSKSEYKERGPSAVHHNKNLFDNH